MEKKIADEIMETVNRLQLPFIVDQLTEGKIERYSPYYSDHDGICITLTQHTLDTESKGG